MDTQTKKTQCQTLFLPGRLLSTPGALEVLRAEGILIYGLVARHTRGDWGDLSEDDKQANEDALTSGARIFSSYELPKTQEKVWVITEADRSSTTILLPEEY